MAAATTSGVPTVGALTAPMTIATSQTTGHAASAYRHICVKHKCLDEIDKGWS